MKPESLASIRTVLGYVSLAFAVIALAKLFGTPIPAIPGSVEQLALVAIALKMA